MRAVLDPNVLIAALLSRTGPPARIVGRWLAGDFELVVSEAVLAELEPAFGYPRLLDHMSPDEASKFLSLLADGARIAADPAELSRRSVDPGDDYLLALAEAERAVLVSGDRHLLDLADRFPVASPREFLEALDRAR